MLLRKFERVYDLANGKIRTMETSLCNRVEILQERLSHLEEQLRLTRKMRSNSQSHSRRSSFNSSGAMLQKLYAKGKARSLVPEDTYCSNFNSNELLKSSLADGFSLNERALLLKSLKFTENIFKNKITIPAKLYEKLSLNLSQNFVKEKCGAFDFKASPVFKRFDLLSKKMANLNNGVAQYMEHLSQKQSDIVSRAFMLLKLHGPKQPRNATPKLRTGLTNENLSINSINNLPKNTPTEGDDLAKIKKNLSSFKDLYQSQKQLLGFFLEKSQIYTTEVFDLPIEQNFKDKSRLDSLQAELSAKLQIFFEKAPAVMKSKETLNIHAEGEFSSFKTVIAKEGAALRNFVDKIKYLFDYCNSLIQQLQNENQDLQRADDSKSQKIRELEKETDKIKSSFNAKMTSIQSEKNDLEKQLLDLRNTGASTKRHMMKLASDLKAHLSMLKNQKSSVNGFITCELSALKTSIKSLASLRLKTLLLSSERSSQEQIKRLLEALQVSKDGFANMKTNAENSSLIKQFDGLYATVATVKSDLVRLKLAKSNKIRTLQNQLFVMNEELHSSKTQIAELSAKLEEITVKTTSQFEELKQEKTCLGQQLESSLNTEKELIELCVKHESDNNELISKIADLEARFATSEEELSKSKTELEELSKLNFSLNGQTEALKLQLTQMHAEIEGITCDLADAQSTIARQTSEIEQLSEDSRQGEVMMESLKQQFDNERERLRSEIKELKASLCGIQENEQRKMSEITKLEQSLEQTRSQIYQDASSQLQEKQFAIENLETEKKTLQDSLSQSHAQARSLLSKLAVMEVISTATIQNMQKELVESQSQIAQLNSSIATQLETIGDLQQEKVNLTAQINDLGQLLTEKNEMIEGLQSDMDALNSIAEENMKAAESERNVFYQKIQELKDSLKGAERSLEQKQSDLEKLALRLEDDCHALETKDSAVKVLNQAIADLESQLIETQSRLSATESQLKQHVVAAFMDNLINLVASNEHQNQISAQSAQIDSQAAVLKQLESQSEARIAALTNENADLIIRLDTINSQLAEVKHRESQATAEIKTLTEKLEQTTQDLLKDASAQLQDKHRELNELEKNLHQRKVELQFTLAQNCVTESIYAGDLCVWAADKESLTDELNRRDLTIGQLNMAIQSLSDELKCVSIRLVELEDSNSRLIAELVVKEKELRDSLTKMSKSHEITMTDLINEYNNRLKELEHRYEEQLRSSMANGWIDNVTFQLLKESQDLLHQSEVDNVRSTEEGQRQELEGKLERYESQMRYLEEKNNSIIAQMHQEREEWVMQLEETHQAAEQEISALKSQLEYLQASVEENNLYFEQKEMQINQLTEQLETVTLSLEEVSAQKANLETNLSETQKELRSISDDLTEIRNIVVSYEHREKQLKTDLSNKELMLNQAISNGNEQKGVVESIIQVEVQKNAAYEEKITIMRRQLDELTAVQMNSLEANHQLKDKADELAHKLDDLKTELKDKNCLLESLTLQKAQQDMKITELENALAESTRLSASLESHLCETELSARYEQAAASVIIAENRAEIRNLHSLLRNLIDQSSLVFIKNQEEGSSNLEIDELITTLFAPLVSNTSISGDCSQVFQPLKAACRSFFDKMLTLLNQQKSFDKIKNENDFLQRNLTNLEQRLTEAVEFIADIQKTLETLNKENITLSTQLITKKQSFENLKENSKEVSNMLKEKINSLQEKIDSLTRHNEYLNGLLLKIDVCYLRESLDTNNFSSAYNQTEKITVTNLNQKSIEGGMQTINSIHQVERNQTIAEQVQPKTKTIPEIEDQKPWFENEEKENYHSDERNTKYANSTDRKRLTTQRQAKSSSIKRNYEIRNHEMINVADFQPLSPEIFNFKKDDCSNIQSPEGDVINQFEIPTREDGVLQSRAYELNDVLDYAWRLKRTSAISKVCYLITFSQLQTYKSKLALLEKENESMKREVLVMAEKLIEVENQRAELEQEFEDMHISQSILDHNLINKDTSYVGQSKFEVKSLGKEVIGLLEKFFKLRFECSDPSPDFVKQLKGKMMDFIEQRKLTSESLQNYKQMLDQKCREHYELEQQIKQRKEGSQVSTPVKNIQKSSVEKRLFSLKLSNVEFPANKGREVDSKMEAIGESLREEFDKMFSEEDRIRQLENSLHNDLTISQHIDAEIDSIELHPKVSVRFMSDKVEKKTAEGITEDEHIKYLHKISDLTQALSIEKQTAEALVNEVNGLKIALAESQTNKLQSGLALEKEHIKSSFFQFLIQHLKGTKDAKILLDILANHLNLNADERETLVGYVAALEPKKKLVTKLFSK